MWVSLLVLAAQFCSTKVIRQLCHMLPTHLYKVVKDNHSTWKMSLLIYKRLYFTSCLDAVMIFTDLIQYCHHMGSVFHFISTEQRSFKICPIVLQ